MDEIDFLGGGKNVCNDARLVLLRQFSFPPVAIKCNCDLKLHGDSHLYLCFID